MTPFMIVKRRVCCFFASRISRSLSAKGTSCSTVLIILPMRLRHREKAKQSASLETPTRSLRGTGALQPADQQLALIDHFRRQSIVQIQKQLFLTEHFLAPGAVIERL